MIARFRIVACATLLVEFEIDLEWIGITISAVVFGKFIVFGVSLCNSAAEVSE